MIHGQLIKLLGETSLSPEKLAPYLRISNLTYRRWLKKPPAQKLPKEYERNVAGGVYQLLQEGHLRNDSPLVADFLEHNLPDFFGAVVGQFALTEGTFDPALKHEDKITAFLVHLGNNQKIQDKVRAQTVGIRQFCKWGDAWKERITCMLSAIRSKKLSLADKLVAYGALFYLILPFDLIPDSIPVFGYIDDFGILGFAMAYYAKRFPELLQPGPAHE